MFWFTPEQQKPSGFWQNRGWQMPGTMICHVWGDHRWRLPNGRACAQRDQGQRRPVTGNLQICSKWKHASIMEKIGHLSIIQKWEPFGVCGNPVSFCWIGFSPCSSCSQVRMRLWGGDGVTGRPWSGRRHWLSLREHGMAGCSVRTWQSHMALNTWQPVQGSVGILSMCGSGCSISLWQP